MWGVLSSTGTAATGSTVYYCTQEIDKTLRIDVDEGPGGGLCEGAGVADRLGGLRQSPAATNSTSASTASTPSGFPAMSGLFPAHNAEDGYETCFKRATQLCAQMHSLVHARSPAAPLSFVSSPLSW